MKVRGRKKPIEILFNLEHPDQLTVVTEVDENGDDDDEDIIEDETDSSDDELQRRFDKMTFVVATKKLEQLAHWIKVSEVFKTDDDRLLDCFLALHARIAVAIALVVPCPAQCYVASVQFSGFPSSLSSSLRWDLVSFCNGKLQSQLRYQCLHGRETPRDHMEPI